MATPSRSLLWPLICLFLCALLVGSLFSVWTQSITSPLAQVASGECEPEPDCCAGGGVGCSPGQLAGCAVPKAPVPPSEPPKVGSLPAGQGALTAQQNIAAALSSW